MKTKKGLPRLIEISGGKKGLLMVSSILVIIHGILSMVPYFIIFMILKNIMAGEIDFHGDILTFFPMAFAAIGISFLLMFLSGTASHIAAFNILYELRCKVAQKLGQLPMGYLDKRNTGELKKILINDIERMESFIAHNLPDTVKAVSLPLTIITGLFFVDWRLALVSIIPFFVFIIIIKKSFGSDEALIRLEKYHKSLEEMNSGITEFVRAVPVMKIFGQTASSFNKFHLNVKDFDEHIRNWTKNTAPLIGMVISFANNALLPILVAGLYFYYKNSLELSVFILFMILGIGYLKPIFKLASMGPQITLIGQGVKRIDEIILNTEIPIHGDLPFPEDTSIEFENVSFSYNKKTDALKNINFKILKGKTIALVGPSGSGKTTIAKLIPGFYPPDSGEIKIGGININKISQKALMENIGFMFQDNMIFRRSIYDNILMGMKKSKNQVIEAAKQAHCHDFIKRLPRGYQSIYGEKGTRLSGGEKQRIQLARVLLKNPPILILDEATASIDAENEDLILNSMKNYIGNKTIIIIAHRLSAIAEIPGIILLEKGGINALGSHEDLIRNSPLYLKMWNAHKRSSEFSLN